MFTYLALGDSYTIGEQVLLSESFPYQTVQMLRSKGFQVASPEIVAKTGCTTDELISAMDGTLFLKNYDFISLLIGVNNQYRGRDTVNFAIEFEDLLRRAIVLAGKNADKVFVLSIPDWGVTPFAEGKNREDIAKEINAFNDLSKAISAKYGSPFIDITSGQRKEGHLPEMLAADGLHPSGKEYTKWAEKLTETIIPAV